MDNFSIKHNISIGAWNVNGLEYKNHGTKCNKLQDPDIMKYFEKLDCIGLLETHANQLIDISLPGFYCFRKDRLKHKNAWRSSGGITVLVKESLRHIFKFDPVSDSDIVWVRVQKTYTKLMSDLYIAFIYLPPLNSTYGKLYGKDIMQKIEKQIEYFSCKGKVVICGDLNARVGNSLDITQKEDDPHLPVPLDNTFETILPRVSHDNCTINQSGRWLIDVCVDNQLYMLNGRTLAS